MDPETHDQTEAPPEGNPETTMEDVAAGLRELSGEHPPAVDPTADPEAPPAPAAAKPTPAKPADPPPGDPAPPAPQDTTSLLKKFEEERANRRKANELRQQFERERQQIEQERDQLRRQHEEFQARLRTDPRSVASELGYSPVDFARLIVAGELPQGRPPANGQPAQPGQPQNGQRDPNQALWQRQIQAEQLYKQQLADMQSKIKEMESWQEKQLQQAQTQKAIEETRGQYASFLQNIPAERSLVSKLVAERGAEKVASDLFEFAASFNYEAEDPFLDPATAAEAYEQMIQERLGPLVAAATAGTSGSPTTPTPNAPKPAGKAATPSSTDLAPGSGAAQDPDDWDALEQLVGRELALGKHKR